jgi:hypothetical protein
MFHARVILFRETSARRREIAQMVSFSTMGAMERMAKEMQRILITGAAGQIGVALREGLHGSYPLVRLLDVAPLGKARIGEEILTADIRDIAAMERAMTGIDCQLYADKYGLSVACLRIGTFLNPDRPADARQLLTWISHRDMVQLVRRCIDYPDYHFVIIYGVSNNVRGRWDNTNVKFLGYRPEDNSEVFASEILATGAQEDEIAAQFHGGFYCPMEFAGDPTMID